MRSTIGKIFSFGLVAILFLSTLGYGQISIPLKDQIPVILKSLNYDKTLAPKINKEVHIAVLYDEGNELSKMAMEAVVKQLGKNSKIKIYRKKNKAIPIPYTNKDKLEKKVFVKKLHVFIICSGLETNYADINEVAKYNKIITVSLNGKDITDGKAVMGVTGEPDAYKPYINLQLAKNNNVDLDFKLLKISEVIK